MENAPRVLRIDSRFRVSGTSTNFTYQLPESMQFPEGTRAHVSAVSLPYSWWNVDANVNDTLYVLEFTGSVYTPRALKLAAGQYTSLTLPTVIQNALNSGTSLGPLTYTVTYVSAQGCLSIQLTGTGNAAARFRLPSEDELMSSTWATTYWRDVNNNVVAYNQRDPASLGDLLRLPSTSSLTTSLQTGLLDVGPQHVLYLKSNLGTFNTVGPRGERDIISRVPVDVSYGYVIHYRETGSEPDFFDISNVSFRTLTFSLTNSKGAVIDLHGGQISIEIIFDEKDPR